MIETLALSRKCGFCRAAVCAFRCGEPTCSVTSLRVGWSCTVLQRRSSLLSECSVGTRSGRGCATPQYECFSGRNTSSSTRCASLHPPGREVPLFWFRTLPVMATRRATWGRCLRELQSVQPAGLYLPLQAQGLTCSCCCSHLSLSCFPLIFTLSLPLHRLLLGKRYS